MFAVIWNHVPQPQVAPGHNLYFGCVPPLPGVAAGAALDNPEVLDWDEAHPINRFLDFDNLVIARTTALVLPDSAVTLLRSSRTALIAALEGPQGGVCIVGFDPLQSNWPLLVSFPLFLTRCLDFFEEQQLRRAESNLPVGKSLPIPVREGAPSVTTPSGERKSVSRSAGGEFIFNGVDHVGIYEVQRVGEPPWLVAANLFDRNESQLTPVDAPVIGGRTVHATPAAQRTNRELWKYLLAGMAALLVIEWIVYHRRWFV